MKLKVFFVDDKFYSDLDEYISEMKEFYDDELKDMPDDWEETIELSIKEKVLEVSPESIFQLLYDSNEERFPDDESIDKSIITALNSCIDFKKLNEMIPELLYPSGKFQKITKKDLTT